MTARRSRRGKTRHVTPIIKGAVVEFGVELTGHPNARLTGGHVDADWRAAAATGEEAVVDELGEALGVVDGLSPRRFSRRCAFGR